MSELQRFAFPATGQQVRSLLIDGEPWFVAADVARILGYRMASDMTRRLDEDEKGTHSARTPGGAQDMAVISEPGLYTAVLGSKVHDAKAFKRWVTHDVLPAIRRTGTYTVQPQHVIPTSYAEALELAAKQARDLEAKAARIAVLEPGAARADRLAQTEGLALIGTVAKRFGLQERKLREFLYADGALIRDGSRRNEPMARYVQAGYFDVEVHIVGEPARSVSTTKVTPRGELWIWARLHRAGVVGRPHPPMLQPSLDDEYAT
jgi:prophage antirepressor-like protein